MRSGFVALLGLPNAGKSTLVNALIGEKVGIVSRKPQTTRSRVVGILNTESAQVCYVDSPGQVAAEQGLNFYLQEELKSVIQDADAVLCVLNLDAVDMESLIKIVEVAKVSGKPYGIVINKRDLDPGLREAKLRDRLKGCNVPLISCSATHLSERVKNELIEISSELLPENMDRLFDSDIFTTQKSRELAAEVVREKCFEYLHQEIPYGLAVKTLKYEEASNLIKIYVEIIVAKENHLGMVLGQGGQMIKRIGASARIELEKILDTKVFLDTKVKVRANWTRNPGMLRELGYVVAEK